MFLKDSPEIITGRGGRIWEFHIYKKLDAHHSCRFRVNLNFPLSTPLVMFWKIAIYLTTGNT
jgi:hypothetical protein